MPMVGHLAENSLEVGDEFREGNDAPAAHNLAFIKHCEAQMPKGKRVSALRADSAAYQAEIINSCESHHQQYAIGTCLDTSARETISAIPETAWVTWGDVEIAETSHSMNKTPKAFRLIVLLRGISLTRVHPIIATRPSPVIVLKTL